MVELNQVELDIFFKSRTTGQTMDELNWTWLTGSGWPSQLLKIDIVLNPTTFVYIVNKNLIKNLKLVFMKGKIIKIFFQVEFNFHIMFKPVLVQLPHKV